MSHAASTPRPSTTYDGDFIVRAAQATREAVAAIEKANRDYEAAQERGRAAARRLMQKRGGDDR